MLVGLSQIALERNEIAAATDDLERVAALGEGLGLPQNPYRWRVARARLREAQGDLTGAVDLLDEAERVYVGDFSPDVCPVAARRARVLVALGRTDDALDWARRRELTADDDLSYVREFEHLTLARILLHQKDADGTARAAAYGLLDRLRVAAEKGGRTGTLIEVLALQALAVRSAPGRLDLRRALDTLERALRLAEPEGYVRTFVGEGALMADLLGALVRQRPLVALPAPPPPGDRGCHDRPEAPGPRRPAERTRARRAPPPRHRPQRAGDRAASSTSRSTPCARTRRTSTPSSAWASAGRPSRGRASSACSDPPGGPRTPPARRTRRTPAEDHHLAHHMR